VSVRLGFLSFYAQVLDRSFFGPDGRNTLSHRDILKIYGSVVQEVKDEMKRQGREDEFIGSRVSYHQHSVRTPCTLTTVPSERLSIPPSR